MLHHGGTAACATFCEAKNEQSELIPERQVSMGKAINGLDASGGYISDAKTPSVKNTKQSHVTGISSMFAAIEYGTYMP